MILSCDIKIYNNIKFKYIISNNDSIISFLIDKKNKFDY